MTTPLRTMLFTPADHPRRVEKALSLPADAVILDLEDAVAIGEKSAARAAARAALAMPRRAAAYVRINALTTEWAHRDLVAVVAPGLDGVMLPKAESARDVAVADWLLGALERDAGLPPGRLDLLPLIETAAGVLAAPEIARASPRLRRLAFGAADYTGDTGMTWSRDELELLPARAALVAASRAAGLEAPVDTVWAALSDAEGFVASAERARSLGFAGKLVIHPDQVAVANRAFSPDPAAVARARRIADAFSRAEAEGVASIQLDGAFVDTPIAVAARRLLARAEAIATLEARANG